MKINTFKHFSVDAFKSLKRNFTISIASVATVAATLFIFGIFLLVMNNANKIVNTVESQVEIRVYLNEDINMMDQRNIEVALKQNVDVEKAVYESKLEALEKFKEMVSDGETGIFSGIDEKSNPLPASFIVKVKEPKLAEGVANSVKDMTGVEEVKNDKELIAKIISITKALRWVGLSIFALLMGISLFLIINTIRLTVFSRRREIGIMKFVGATDWFIRWPFIIEGVVIGLIGAVIANLSLYGIYKYAISKIADGLIMVNVISPTYVLHTVSWQFALAGAVIGAIGSIIALRKFLTV